MSDPQGLTFDTAAMLEGIEAVDVLDLAAGTGKLTNLLLERYHHVIAVEPLPGMRALLPPAASRALRRPR
jgi:16S rRNA A1518/A1519 N6-dimethyltransferase RsmA/KsgA/DIM1 with predicted DNA glycosylase/AP lyase activity